ncbi:MAG: ABC transporter substrate-binding protein [Rhodocyclaceae bacterium]|nr:MAG: ABC transporter substrate-binding protein [Rhodocyclaceae bacterium]
MKTPRILFALLLGLALHLPVQAADLSIGLAADVSSLDPHYLNVAPNIAIASHFFDTLVTVDADSKLAPGLAESWKAINATTWEFKLRRGIKFSDGSELTTEDVVFSLNRPATLTNSPGPFTPFTKIISGKQAVDAHTLRLTTSQPYGPLPLDLSSIFIVSKKAAENASSEDFNSGKALVGSGPYTLLRFKRGESIEMARNALWWGYRDGRATQWDKVTFRLLPADGPRLAALLAGQVDAIEGAPAADLPRLKADARFHLEQRISWRTLFLQLDQYRDKSPFITDANGKALEKNPLKDARVRLALSKAIHRQALTERTLEGLGVPAANVVSPGILGHVAARKVEAYDPDGARQLLQEAGYADGFSLTLHGPNNRYINDDQILQTVAQFWSRIGVKTKVETMPLSVYFGRLRKADFSIGLLGWGSLAGDFALKNLVATPNAAEGWGAWNWGQYSNPKVDQLLHESLASVDDGKRRKLAEQTATAALGDTALIPLHHQIATWAMKKGLRATPRLDEFTFAWQFRPE